MFSPSRFIGLLLACEINVISNHAAQQLDWKTGLHEPTAGRIFFNDRDVTPLHTDKRNAVNDTLVLQPYRSWPQQAAVAENTA